MQGGMIALPIPAFPTGVMRGRFSPADRHLYLCGMFSWAGSAQHPGGMYRLRATGKTMHLPVRLHAVKRGIKLVFSSPLAPASVTPTNVQIKTWSLKRTANYGSKHFDERSLLIGEVLLADDGKSVHVQLPHIQPTWCMEIKYAFRSRHSQPVEGTIHNTIHRLND